MFFALHSSAILAPTAVAAACSAQLPARVSMPRHHRRPWLPPWPVAGCMLPFPFAARLLRRRQPCHPARRLPQLGGVLPVARWARAGQGPGQGRSSQPPLRLAGPGGGRATHDVGAIALLQRGLQVWVQGGGGHQGVAHGVVNHLQRPSAAVTGGPARDGGAARGRGRGKATRQGWHAAFDDRGCSRPHLGIDVLVAAEDGQARALGRATQLQQ
jgi:hypothetical protein